VPRWTSKRRQVLSLLPVTTYAELGCQLTHYCKNGREGEVTSISPRWPANIRIGFICSTLHIRPVASPLPLTKYCPNGPHLTSHTGCECPLYTTTALYVSALHNRIVLSPDPVSKYAGLLAGVGDQETLYTGAEWPIIFGERPAEASSNSSFAFNCPRRSDDKFHIRT